MNLNLTKRILSSLVILPVTLYFIIKGSFLFILFLLVCFICTSYEWHMMSKRKNYYIFGFLFLILSFYSAYLLRNNLYNINGLYFFICVGSMYINRCWRLFF